MGDSLDLQLTKRWNAPSPGVRRFGSDPELFSERRSASEVSDGIPCQHVRNYRTAYVDVNRSSKTATGQNSLMPKKTVGQLVLAAREQRGWTQSELAKRSGLSQPTLSALEAGETTLSNIKLSTVAQIASALGVPIGDLLGTNTDTAPVFRARLPLVSWISAGNPHQVFDPYSPGAAEDWIPFQSMATPNSYCLRVRGDSMMRPDGTGFPDGCIIAVDPVRKPKSGDFVVVRFTNSDEATFKQYFVEGGTKYLKPLNPAYPTILVSSDAHLAGVVFEMQIVKKF